VGDQNHKDSETIKMQQTVSGMILLTTHTHAEMGDVVAV
jgi:hypothetical protein